MSRIKYVLIDFDGTIADTSEGIFYCLNTVMEKMGKRKLSPETLRKFIGPPLDMAFSVFAKLTKEETVKATNLFRTVYAGTGAYMSPLYDGMIEFINKLHKTGRKTVIATSKPYKQTVAMLRDKNIFDLFDYVSGSSTNRMGQKKVDIISHALQAINATDISETVMIGDRKYDIEAGKDLGMITIAVRWGFGNDKEFTEAGSDYIADTPEDLIEIIDSIE